MLQLISFAFTHIVSLKAAPSALGLEAQPAQLQRPVFEQHAGFATHHLGSTQRTLESS